MIRIEREDNGQKCSNCRGEVLNTPTYFFYEAIGLICKKMYIYKIKISTPKSAYIQQHYVRHVHQRYTYIQVGNKLKNRNAKNILKI